MPNFLRISVKKFNPSKSTLCSLQNQMVLERTYSFKFLRFYNNNFSFTFLFDFLTTKIVICWVCDKWQPTCNLFVFLKISSMMNLIISNWHKLANSVVYLVLIVIAFCEFSLLWLSKDENSDILDVWQSTCKMIPTFWTFLKFLLWRLWSFQKLTLMNPLESFMSVCSLNFRIFTQLILYAYILTF